MSNLLHKNSQRNQLFTKLFRMVPFSLACLLSLEAVMAFHRPTPGLSRRNPTMTYGGTHIEERRVETTETAATRLNYSDGAEYPDDSELSGDISVARNQHSWWTRLGPNKNTDNDSKQEAVDSYLEFLERRYHRLYDDEQDDPSRKEPKFSAWKWLTHGTDDMEQTILEQDGADQENALYVLGVAGLASKRYLQRHQLPLREKNSYSEAFATSTSRSHPASQADAPDAAAPSSSLMPSRLFKRLSTQRKLLLRYQSRKLKALAHFFIATIRAGPGKIINKALELGGGKRSIAFTSTMAAALVYFVVRPLVQAIISEGASHP